MGNKNSINKDEKPVHKIKINYDFMIGQYEITNDEFVTFLNESQASFKTKATWLDVKSEDTGSHITFDKEYRVESRFENHPVVEISWFGAKAYVRWLAKKTGEKYRLPSESEWEYVARAGTKTKWYSSNRDNRVKLYAWYSQNSHDGAYKVGLKKPNKWGVYDMAGNVYEWCEDKYDRNYKYTPKDGTPNSNRKNMRVLRGGSWLNGAYATRPSSRFKANPFFRDDSIGFRIAKDVTPIDKANNL